MHGYDGPIAIACTIDPADIPERVALIGRLRAAHTDLARTELGLVIAFPAPAADDVRRFARDEQACCAFWRFAVGVEGDTVTLRWDGPPDAAQIVDGLETYFRGAGELDAALAGLL